MWFLKSISMIETTLANRFLSFNNCQWWRWNHLSQSLDYIYKRLFFENAKQTVFLQHNSNKNCICRKSWTKKVDLNQSNIKVLNDMTKNFLSDKIQSWCLKGSVKLLAFKSPIFFYLLLNKTHVRYEISSLNQ